MLAADIASHAEAAIPSLAIPDPLSIQAVRGHPATEARDEQRPIVAEVVAGGVLIEEKFAKGGFFAFGGVAVGRCDRDTHCPSGDRGNDPPKQTLEQTSP